MVFLLTLWTALARAETLWVSSPTDGVRWADNKAVSLHLQAGDEVEVVYRDGAKVRVRKGVEFGWVDASALTSVQPPKPDAAPVPPPVTP